MNLEMKLQGRELSSVPGESVKSHKLHKVFISLVGNCCMAETLST